MHPNCPRVPSQSSPSRPRPQRLGPLSGGARWALGRPPGVRGELVCRCARGSPGVKAGTSSPALAWGAGGRTLWGLEHGKWGPVL